METGRGSRAVTTQCRSCRAPVIWAVTRAGKRIPLDAAPSATGNLVYVGQQLDGTEVVGAPRDGDPPEFRYVSHFATCPDAGEWRRR